MEASDIFIHTKTIPCSVDPNLCAPRTTWHSAKVFSTELTSWSRVVNKEWTQFRCFTSWRNLTVIAALLKDVPMGCKDAVLAEPLLKNCTTNCLMFQENTRQSYQDNLRPYRALALHFHGNHRLEKQTSKFFNSFINTMDGVSSNQSKGVHMNDIPFVEDLLTLNTLLYNINVGNGNIIGQFARRCVQKYKNTVRLLRYNNHIFYVNNNNAIFKSFRCPNCDTVFFKNNQFGATFNKMKWKSEKFLSKKRISNPRNSFWQANGIE